MKKFRCLICFLLVFSTLASIFFTVNAAENNTKAGQRSGITIDRVETNGVTHPEGYYWSDKKLEELPVTYEAWIYIPKEVYDESGNVILGNVMDQMYDFTLDDWFSFEIKWKGEPRLMYGYNGGCAEVVFWESGRIPADTWTHLTIVHNQETKMASCYLNGRMVQKKSFDFTPSKDTIDNPFYLAGDGTRANSRAFPGSIGDVAVYSDVRTATEIMNDYKKGPDLNDENLLLSYELSADMDGKDIEDKSGNGYNMNYYRTFLTEEEMNEIRKSDDKEYDYSIAFIPDLQYVTDRYPSKLAPVFNYVINNKNSKNIKYVVGLGDMTDRCKSDEWVILKKYVDRLNGVLPYSLIRGNHDIYTENAFNDLFGQKTSEYYKHVEANGGFYRVSSATSTYLLFEENGIKYMLLNIDFGVDENVLNWADRVISKHPDHRVIIVTHAYLNSNGEPLSKGEWATPSNYNASFIDPDKMWENHFKKHENIDIIIGGHMHSDQIIVTPVEGEKGNTVYQILIDSQFSDITEFKGLGLVALMHFTKDGRFAKIEYYSTAYKRYYYEGHTDILLDFGEKASEEVIPDENIPQENPENSGDVVPDKQKKDDSILWICLAAGAATVCVVVVITICVLKKKRVKRTND